MEIWCDGACSAAHAIIKQGWITGVTTNPKILSLQEMDAQKQLCMLLDAQHGPVAAQISAKTSEGMLEQAKKLHAFSDRIVVKVPFVPQGIEIIPTLISLGIPTLATAVFNAAQFLLAATLKVDYVAPYLSHMTQAGYDAIEEVRLMQAMIVHYGFKTKVMAASIQDISLIKILASMGVASMTLSPQNLRAWCENADSIKSTQRLNETWQHYATRHAGSLFAEDF